jgi:hypothetical protein
MAMLETEPKSHLYRQTLLWLCALGACAFVVMMLLNSLWSRRLARNADIPGVLSVLAATTNHGVKAHRYGSTAADERVALNTNPQAPSVAKLTQRTPLPLARRYKSGSAVCI